MAAQDGHAEPLAGHEGEFDVYAVLPDGMAQALLGLAHAVLDGVLVQGEALGGGLVAPVFLEEDPQRVAEPGVLVVVVRERTVRRNPDTPCAGLPKANRSAPPAAWAPSRQAVTSCWAPSGSQAQALDSSCGTNMGRPSHCASAATCLVACSSSWTVSLTETGPVIQVTTPRWYCRSR